MISNANTSLQSTVGLYLLIKYIELVHTDMYTVLVDYNDYGKPLHLVSGNSEDCTRICEWIIELLGEHLQMGAGELHG